MPPEAAPLPVANSQQSKLEQNKDEEEEDGIAEEEAKLQDQVRDAADGPPQLHQKSEGEDKESYKLQFESS